MADTTSIIQPILSPEHIVLMDALHSHLEAFLSLNGFLIASSFIGLNAFSRENSDNSSVMEDITAVLAATAFGGFLASSGLLFVSKTYVGISGAVGIQCILFCLDFSFINFFYN